MNMQYTPDHPPSSMTIIWRWTVQLRFFPFDQLGSDEFINFIWIIINTSALVHSENYIIGILYIYKLLLRTYCGSGVVKCWKTFAIFDWLSTSFQFESIYSSCKFILKRKSFAVCAHECLANKCAAYKRSLRASVLYYECCHILAFGSTALRLKSNSICKFLGISAEKLYFILTDSINVCVRITSKSS